MRSGAFRTNWVANAACASTASRREIRDRDRTCVITVSAAVSSLASIRGSRKDRTASLVRSLIPYRASLLTSLVQARSSSR